mmetsp:Transcript_6240/g.13476  ORF Transcript_6240/g.13476 Transcript_6240/m.13476 type:complete len:231 (-) Transcript_6240:954-1646(-)
MLAATNRIKPPKTTKNKTDPPDQVSISCRLDFRCLDNPFPDLLRCSTAVKCSPVTSGACSGVMLLSWSRDKDLRGSRKAARTSLVISSPDHPSVASATAWKSSSATRVRCPEALPLEMMLFNMSSRWSSRGKGTSTTVSKRRRAASSMASGLLVAARKKTRSVGDRVSCTTESNPSIQAKIALVRDLWCSMLRPEVREDSKLSASSKKTMAGACSRANSAIACTRCWDSP